MSHSCSGNCGNCGSCGSCGGCAGELSLSLPEVQLLRTLGQLAFLPVARRADSMTPVYLEETEHTAEEYSRVLLHLEAKGLISLDYDKPLAGFDMAAYAAWPVHGSAALTARGQQVLEAMELQGIREEA